MFVTSNSFRTGKIAPITPREETIDKGFGESLEDAWDYTTYNGRNISRQQNLHDELQKVVDDVKAKSGILLKNPLRDGYEEFGADSLKVLAKRTAGISALSTFSDLSDMIMPSRKSGKQEKEINKFLDQVNQLSAEYPEIVVPDFEQIQDNIKKEALNRQEKFDDGRIGSQFGSFLGQTGALMSDPFNITSMLVGGGGKLALTTVSGALKSIAKVAAIEGGANAAAEAVIQPSVYQYKNELGEEYSAGEALQNVAYAGVGGAVLGVGLRGVGTVTEKMLHRFRAAETSGVKFSPRELAAAEVLEQKVELDNWLYKTNPNADTITGTIVHEQKIIREMNRLLYEQDAVGRAYDEVKSNPVGAKDDPLVIIQPEDMAEVRIERGEYYPKKRSGYGLVKIEWKHGETGTDAIPVMRDDVVAFPKVIREYEPIPNHGYGSNRTWSVLRKDGAQVIYADSEFVEDGGRRLVSVYVVDPNTPKGSELAGILSAKKNPQSGTENLRSSNFDTASGAFGRSPESEGLYSKITPEAEKVNVIQPNKSKYDFDRDEFLEWLKEIEKPVAEEPKLAKSKLEESGKNAADELRQRLDNEDFIVPVEGVNGEVQMKSARELLAEYDASGNYAAEIADCIIKFAGSM